MERSPRRLLNALARLRASRPGIFDVARLRDLILRLQPITDHEILFISIGVAEPMLGEASGCETTLVTLIDRLGTKHSSGGSSKDISLLKKC